MAIDEDVEDKLRRNLVGASASILLSTFLDISTTDFAGTLIGNVGNKVDEWKMYSAALAVFSYLALRYWHSKPRVAAWKLLHEEIWKRRQRFVKDDIQKDLDRYTNHGLLPRRFANPQRLVQAMERTESEWPDSQSRQIPTDSALARVGRPRLGFAWGAPTSLKVIHGQEPRPVDGDAVTTGYANYSGTGTLAMTWLGPQGRVTSSDTLTDLDGAPISYAISKRVSLWMTLRSVGISAVNSPGGLEFAWVIVLALFAALLLLWGLFGAL